MVDRIVGPVSLSEHFDGSRRIYLFGDEHRLAADLESGTPFDQFLIDLDKTAKNKIAVYLETPYYRLRNGRSCTPSYYICQIYLELEEWRLKNLQIIKTDFRGCCSELMTEIDSLPGDEYTRHHLPALKKIVHLIDNTTTNQMAEVFIELIDSEHLIKIDRLNRPVYNRFIEFLTYSMVNIDKSTYLKQLRTIIRKIERVGRSIAQPFIVDTAFLPDLFFLSSLYSSKKKRIISYVGEAHGNALSVFLEEWLGYETVNSTYQFDKIDPYGYRTYRQYRESPQMVDLSGFKQPFFGE